MKLNYLAALNLTSYGYTSAYFLRELLRNNVDVKYFPISKTGLDPEFSDLTDFNQEGYLHDKVPCLKIWHQHDMATFVGRGPHIGFPIFELDSFTDKEKNHLASLDDIIVCSKWAASVVKDQLGVLPKVVPLGYNDKLFKPKETKSRPFIFGNFGKWEVRKGHDILKDAFNMAFQKEDDVELWMMPHNFFLTDYQQRTWVSFYQNSKLGDKVRIFPRIETQAQVADIMGSIDCGIFPTRAEGWNLEALECLGCGKRVISTNYSGHTEFLNRDNSYLVDLPNKEMAFDGIFFNGQGKWGKFSKDILEQMIVYMRKVYEDGPMLNEAGLQTAKEFTWEKSGIKLVEVLKEYDV